MPKLNIQTGWFDDINHTPSPNHNQRPENTILSLIVIHNISLPPNQFGEDFVEAFFTNKLDPKGHPYFETISTLKVSSHLYIKRSGEVIQFVSLKDRAWHAGVSSFEGVEDCNNYSIGIELEGDDETPFKTIQYEKLVKLTKEIQSCHPEITKERIVGHSTIAPGRKTDPGPYFNWQNYLNRIT